MERNRSIVALANGITVMCWLVLLVVVVYWFGYTTTIARIAIAAVVLAAYLFGPGMAHAGYNDLADLFSPGKRAGVAVFFASLFGGVVLIATWFSVPIGAFLTAAIAVIALIAVASMQPSEQVVIEEEVDDNKVSVVPVKSVLPKPTTKTIMEVDGVDEAPVNFQALLNRAKSRKT